MVKFFHKDSEQQGTCTARSVFGLESCGTSSGCWICAVSSTYVTKIQAS